VTAYSGQVPDTEPAGQWINQAACRAPDIHPDEMFPDNNETGIAHAKAICRPCPVQVDCVLDALRTGDNEHGIRGALKPCERRAMADELARRRKAAGENPPTAPKARPVRTLQTLWDERSVPLGEGHTGWTGAVPVALDRRYYTPQQISFRLDRGHAPSGIVRRTCEVDGCVLPAHLMDQAERDARRAAEDAAARAAAPTPAPASTGRRLAPCGTRSAYQRHIRNREPIDDACRAENTASRTRLTRTGTTKALA
jgi:hypothetical protein